MRSDAGPWSSREFLSAYISGYADGEGCFTVSISPRAKLLVGWEVRPSFSVSQNGDRAEVLHALQAYFVCGRFRPARMAQRPGRCLHAGSGESLVAVKMPSTRGWTESPREPLLQLDVGVWGVLSRIGGRL